MIGSRRYWTNSIECFAVLFGLFVVTVGGCSKPTSKVVGICREPDPASRSAADVVRDVLEGLQHQELQALWTFLPPSFRTDAEGLTHEVGERLDDQSWGPFVETCHKAREVVSRLIKQFEQDGTAIDEPDRELLARLRDVEQLLYWILKSDLGNVARLRQLDGSQLLSQISKAFQVRAAHRALDGEGVEGNPFSMLGGVKVALLSESDCWINEQSSACRGRAGAHRGGALVGR